MQGDALPKCQVLHVLNYSHLLTKTEIFGRQVKR